MKLPDLCSLTIIHYGLKMMESYQHFLKLISKIGFAKLIL